jgi:hypothetical protein
MERITKITPAWDRRDPDPEKNYGIHGCDLRMVLVGELGAVQFVLMTGWFTNAVRAEKGTGVGNLYPLPADLGYHSPVPMYDGQTRIGELVFDKGDILKEPTKIPEKDLPNCEYLGKPCYYDGSGLAAEETFDILTSEGSDGVWKHLEKYYIARFGELK